MRAPKAEQASRAAPTDPGAALVTIGRITWLGTRRN